MKDGKAPSRIEITQFPKGKRIAVTTSFDDGQIFDRRIVEAFNKWGMKGTFNLNSSKLSCKERKSDVHLEAKEVAGLFEGHEVAVHTVTHPHLTKLGEAQIAEEVLGDRKALEDLVGYPVRGMAYPYGSYDQRVIDVIRQLGIVYSRTCENDPRHFPAREPLAWASNGHMFHKDPCPMNEKFEKFYSNQHATGVFFIWGHSYEFDRGGCWDMLEKIFKPISGKPDVWYCTNIELFDYEEARRRLVIAANKLSVFNPCSTAVTINVDGELMDVGPGLKTL